MAVRSLIERSETLLIIGIYLFHCSTNASCHIFHIYLYLPIDIEPAILLVMPLIDQATNISWNACCSWHSLYIIFPFKSVRRDTFFIPPVQQLSPLICIPHDSGTIILLVDRTRVSRQNDGTFYWLNKAHVMSVQINTIRTNCLSLYKGTFRKMWYLYTHQVGTLFKSYCLRPAIGASRLIDLEPSVFWWIDPVYFYIQFLQCNSPSQNTLPVSFLFQSRDAQQHWTCDGGLFNIRP